MMSLRSVPQYITSGIGSVGYVMLCGRVAELAFAFM